VRLARRRVRAARRAGRARAAVCGAGARRGLGRAAGGARGGPWLEIAVEGEELARRLAARFLIERNGSVSDRLWRLVLRGDPDAEDPARDAVVDARWLAEMPAPIWDIVRAQVLRCL